jgi:PAS domain S-box-containing protein
MKQSNRSLSQVRIIYILTTIFLVGLSVYAFIEIKNLIDSSGWVNHTNQVNLSLQRISTSISEAETNQRGFLLTDDSLLLQKKDVALGNLLKDRNLLDSLVKDNPEQIEKAAKLNAAVNAKLIIMQKVLHQYTPLQMTADFKANVIDGVGKMDSVKLYILKMSDAEQQLLKVRKEKYQRLSFITPLFAIVLFLGALFILLVSYLRINTELRQSQELQLKLEKEKDFAQTVLNSSSDNIIVFDKELRYISANPNAEKIIFKTTPDYIGKKVTDIYPDSESVADMKSVLQGEIIHVDNYYSSYTGTSFEAIYTPLKTRNEIIGLIAQSRDISGILKINQQLEKQNEELEERNAFVETLINSSLDLIMVVDKEMRYISINKKAEEVFSKIYPQSIIGKKITDITAGAPVTEVKAALKGENILVKKFKSLVFDKYYEISYTPLWKKNEVYAVMVITHDITASINTEEEIRTLNQMYEYAEQIGMFGSYRYNFSEKKITYSDNLYRLLGCEPNEFPAGAEGFMKFIHPEDVQYVLDATAEAFSHKHTSTWEYRLTCKDGKTIYVRGTGKIFTDKDGLQWMIGTLQDISDEISRKKVLKESEEKFNSLFQLSPFSITLAEASSGRLADVNENYLKTFGFTREEVIGYTSLELNLIDAGEREKIYKTLIEVGTVKNVEVEIRKKTGEKIPALVSIETIVINGEKYYLNAVNDIVERKKAEAKIEQSNQMLQEMNKELQSFAYVSSHDLQEPLRKIQTFATRIIDKEYENLSDNGKDYFNRMQAAARRMQMLIEDLLAYSRTTTTERKYENTDLNKIVEEVKEDLKEELVQTHATIEATEICNVHIIPFQFRQLLHNLITNSLKFSKPEEAPHIKIKSEKGNGRKFKNEKLSDNVNYCHISISDNGIGFEPRYSEKIFELFQRLHAKEEYNGTGIGLAIVKKIVENHNGVITAKAEINKGATFDIYIPAD